MPPGHSTIAQDVDSLMYFIIYASIFFFGLVIFLAAYFTIKYYHRRKAEDTGEPHRDHNTKLEITWAVIPAILCVIVFFWGFKVYMKMIVVPKDALEIKVTGQKWSWIFDYPDGTNSIGDLVVPAGKPIKLLMSSKDVIHSFFIPDFRIKMDVLPNRYTITWFEAPEIGDHNLFCAEFCGDGHSDMLGKVRVVGEREYAEWLETRSSEGEGMTPADYGAKLFVQKACITCHAVDGSEKTGPHVNGIFGKEVPLADGSKVIADENYIRESILNPQASIVAGYDPVMPTYQGLLKDKQIDALIAYIKSLK